MQSADVGLTTIDGGHATMYTKDLMSLGRHMEGKVLTVVEAAITNSDQLKATKSLLRNALWDTLDVVGKWMVKQTGPIKSSFPY